MGNLRINPDVIGAGPNLGQASTLINRGTLTRIYNEFSARPAPVLPTRLTHDIDCGKALTMRILKTKQDYRFPPYDGNGIEFRECTDQFGMRELLLSRRRLSVSSDTIVRSYG